MKKFDNFSLFLKNIYVFNNNFYIKVRFDNLDLSILIVKIKKLNLINNKYNYIIFLITNIKTIYLVFINDNIRVNYFFKY